MDMPIGKGDNSQRKRELCQSYRKCRDWGTEQASFELFGTAGLHVALHQRQRKQQLCGFLLGRLF